MSAISLAIIGKNNKPLYIREFSSNESNSIEAAVSDNVLFGLSKENEESVTADATVSSPQKQQGGEIDVLEAAAAATAAAMHNNNTDCSLRQQFILHAALDRFEHLAGPHPGFGWRKNNNNNNGATESLSLQGPDAMWVGLLCPVENMRVYGYMTTTQIKFMLTVEDDPTMADQRTSDQTLKLLFVKLHRLYVEYILNPFSSINAPIESKRFDRKVGDTVAAFNRIHVC